MANSRQLGLLKQGIDGWNLWREKHPVTIPVLTQADLSDTDLSGANLSGADLGGADLSRASLTQAISSRQLSLLKNSK
ncbi:MAG: pentapeptide repeat-containing protein [Ktedonobacteraceae bacterium]